MVSRATAFTLLLCSAEAVAAQSPIATVENIALHSSFWQNLHVTLYAVARGSMPRELARQLRLPRIGGMAMAPLDGALDPGERRAWDLAVGYYQSDLARRDLRTGVGMTDVHWALAASDDTESPAPPAGLDAEHRAHLAAAAPVYRRYWWPDHDRRIREWIRGAVEGISTVSPDIRVRIAYLLETDWFETPARVEVTYYGRAYTTLEPRPLTLLAVIDPDYSGWAGAEMIFHEVTHALTGPLERRLGRYATDAGRDTSGLWHAVQFFLVGEAWRLELAERGIDYEPHMYANDIFRTALPALEIGLSGYTRGVVDAEAAFDRFVAALPP
ncbi:MAG: hypothetical protein R3195_06550 [Gemmatimonadota bacterium]|nr:hypothetical protein [Gemmatimonadota bacterium]